MQTAPIPKTTLARPVDFISPECGGRWRLVQRSRGHAALGRVRDLALHSAHRFIKGFGLRSASGSGAGSSASKPGAQRRRLATNGSRRYCGKFRW